MLRSTCFPFKPQFTNLGYFQHYNASWHTKQVVSIIFHEPDHVIVQWNSVTSTVSSIVWVVCFMSSCNTVIIHNVNINIIADECAADLQQLCDEIVSMWTRISEKSISKIPLEIHVFMYCFYCNITAWCAKKKCCMVSVMSCMASDLWCEMGLMLQHGTNMNSIRINVRIFYHIRYFYFNYIIVLSHNSPFCIYLKIIAVISL